MRTIFSFFLLSLFFVSSCYAERTIFIDPSSGGGGAESLSELTGGACEITNEDLYVVSTSAGVYVVGSGATGMFTAISGDLRVGTTTNDEVSIFVNNIEVGEWKPGGELEFKGSSGVNLGSGTGFLERPNGTALPATCNVGQVFHDTDSDDCADTGSGDGAICVCKSANTWVLEKDI